MTKSGSLTYAYVAFIFVDVIALVLVALARGTCKGFDPQAAATPAATR